MAGFIDISITTSFNTTFPSRIISAVPSITELLFDLGLSDEVVGITKFCIRPQTWFESKPKIGGTKNININRIHELKPDLIIANKEENRKEQIEELAKSYSVWLTDINTVDEAIVAITQCEKLTNTTNKAEELIKSIKNQFLLLNQIQTKTSGCYLIWREPYMTIGGDTFINSMMNVAGFENIFRDHSRYPIVTIEQIKSKTPAVILLSSEPFPFKEKHLDEIKEQVPGSTVILVDGEMFSWYGSRMLHAPAYFLNLWQHGLYRK